MTTPVLPLQLVPDLPWTDYPFGLLSVAALTDPVDQKEFWSGVEWEPVYAPVPMAGTAQEACPPEPRAAKVLTAGIPKAQATVLRTYTGVRCDAGSMRDDWTERATAAVLRAEQATLEYAAWTGAYGNRPRLADAATAVIGGVTADMGIEQAIGLLDWWLAKRHGLGTIWVSRALGGYLASETLMRVQGSRMVSPGGNPIVLAYTHNGLGIGPAGTAPDAGDAWIYATGPVEVRRSRIFVPELAQALYRATDNVFFLAERSYIVRFNPGGAAGPPPVSGGPGVAAVKVTLPPPPWVAPEAAAFL